jgi:hypothetical protein
MKTRRSATRPLPSRPVPGRWHQQPRLGPAKAYYETGTVKEHLEPPPGTLVGNQEGFLSPGNPIED